MAALRVFLPLAICLLLGHQTFAHNKDSCKPSPDKEGFHKFVKRHIHDRLPSKTDKLKWKELIKAIDISCNRDIQSFIESKYKKDVEAVCTDAGRKTKDTNLCISDKLFKFVTVKSVKGTCEIETVTPEEKHLILACDMLDDKCLPVHFQANPKKLAPTEGMGSCKPPPK